jgi:hypothetical protein
MHVKWLPLFVSFLLPFTLFAQNPDDNKIPRQQADALPSVYPNGVYMFDSENDSPYYWVHDAGIVLGMKWSQSNYRHAQLVIGNNPSFISVRGKDGNNDSWGSWRRVLVQSSNGNFGVNTSSPQSRFHILDQVVQAASTSRYDANFLVQGTSDSRDINEGASIGFVIPANSDGSNAWQQGRILVTPDNANNANASGRMFLQTRYYSSGAWRWRNNLVLKSEGNVGIGTTTPDEKLEVNGTIRSKEVKVEAAPWPDYVFSSNYSLISLQELQDFIDTYGHLPEVPDAETVEEEGIALGEMNALLLKKIEELTMHLIEKDQQINGLIERIEKLENNE